MINEDRIETLTNEFGERLARCAKSDAEFAEMLENAIEILNTALVATRGMSGLDE